MWNADDGVGLFLHMGVAPEDHDRVQLRAASVYEHGHLELISDVEWSGAPRDCDRPRTLEDLEGAPREWELILHRHDGAEVRVAGEVMHCAASSNLNPNANLNGAAVDAGDEALLSAETPRARDLARRGGRLRTPRAQLPAEHAACPIGTTFR